MPYHLPLPKRYRRRGRRLRAHARRPVLRLDGLPAPAEAVPHVADQRHGDRARQRVRPDLRAGRSEMPFAIELCFRPGGSLTGVVPLEGTGNYQLAEGTGSLHGRLRPDRVRPGQRRHPGHDGPGRALHLAERQPGPRRPPGLPDRQDPEPSDPDTAHLLGNMRARFTGTHLSLGAGRVAASTRSTVTGRACCGLRGAQCQGLTVRWAIDAEGVEAADFRYVEPASSTGWHRTPGETQCGSFRRISFPVSDALVVAGASNASTPASAPRSGGGADRVRGLVTVQLEGQVEPVSTSVT